MLQFRRYWGVVLVLGGALALPSLAGGGTAEGPTQAFFGEPVNIGSLVLCPISANPIATNVIDHNEKNIWKT